MNLSIHASAINLNTLGDNAWHHLEHGLVENS
jgi:hypothetical protein